MIRYIYITLLILLCLSLSAFANVKGVGTQIRLRVGESQLLNGNWLQGSYQNGRVHYTSKTQVPAIQLPGNEFNKEALWLMTYLRFKEVAKNDAVLKLLGARFNPKVYINGRLIAELKGGMAPLEAIIPASAFGTDTLIRLEIRLAPLAEVDKKDASAIPDADRWRSNVASCLWDDVSLRFIGSGQIKRFFPMVDSSLSYLTVAVATQTFSEGSILNVKLKNPNGEIVTQSAFGLPNGALALGRAKLPLPKNIKLWSPSKPFRYQLEVELISANGQRQDFQSIPYGIRYFGMENTASRRGFLLNNEPFNARTISVVWHRWVRDQEGRELAYNKPWLLNHIYQKSAAIGANTIRFHLGTPPQRYLNWCDSLGFAVQLEWLFFHGMKAEKSSLIEQWQPWFDMGMQHPSVGWFHPWNETEGEELKTAWQALNSLLPQYGRIILAERDLIHIHKYWWSLFENLGLYYDNALQFQLPIMVDEFGGNYLDSEGELGGYKTLVESYLRYLGPNHTKKERLKHHTLANVKVAEYWRRLGATGYSPFCALGSYEDGNHWYLGPLNQGNPKPVWNALAPAYSPKGISLDFWDRHFLPKQNISLPIYLFNDLPNAESLKWSLQISNSQGKVIQTLNKTSLLKAFSQTVERVSISLPYPQGRYTISAKVNNPTKEIKPPVVSTWEILVAEKRIPESLKRETFFVPEGEKEIISFIDACGLKHKQNPSETSIGIIGKATFQNLKGQHLPTAWQGIKKWLWLDIGPQGLGVSYPEKENQPLVDEAFLQGSPTLRAPQKETISPLLGLQLSFDEQPEAESHIHITKPYQDKLLKRFGLQAEDFWLFNGLRGGLAVPAFDMGVSGLQKQALINLWAQRGADTSRLKNGQPYFAYELSGYYAFSVLANDKDTERLLRQKVKFLSEDAPALKNVVNPNGKISISNLGEALNQNSEGKVASIQPMVVAGRGLTRTPVLAISLIDGKKIIASQLLTAGRLTQNSPGTNERWAIKPDPVMQQLVLGLLDALREE